MVRIVPSKDANALYDAMKRMLDAGYRDILAKNARKWIASRYEQGFVHKCLYDFLRHFAFKKIKGSRHTPEVLIRIETVI